MRDKELLRSHLTFPWRTSYQTMAATSQHVNEAKHPCSSQPQGGVLRDTWSTSEELAPADIFHNVQCCITVSKHFDRMSPFIFLIVLLLICFPDDP